MKRFFILVSLVALVATGCTKTIIKNEVETPISFSTESGKLTRAIVQDDKYLTSQPFGVFAYGSNDNGTPFMNNVEISYTDPTWKATITNQVSTKYYWPNDPRTTINFYAYSPVCSTATMTQNLADHQQLKCTVAHSETNGFSLTGYVHSNMYVDFMVATPVKGATYANPDANANTETEEGSEGKVPMVFHHQMTQIVFNVKTKEDYGNNVHIAVQRIELHNILNTASYVQDYTDSYGAWTIDNNNTKYDYTQTPVFPASANNGAAADDVFNHTYSSAQGAQPDGYKIDANTGLTTKGVTMIPQNMNQATTPVVLGRDDLANETTGQMFKIVYSIKGTGVASEVVTKHIPFYAKEVVDAETIVNWAPNRKITYNVVIGLNEITFEPSVAEWDDTDEKNNNDPDDDEPYGDEFTFAQ